MARPIPKLKHQQHISLDQLLKNPLGKYSANVIRRSFARSSMQIFYWNLMRDYRHAVSVQGYNVDNRIFFIVMIPSEAYKWNKTRYTVIIEFMNDPSFNRPFIHRDVKYYSNSPNYQFTYEYVLYHRGLIPDSLTPLLSDIAINNPPIIRNPQQTLGFEKSLYAAARILHEGPYLTRFYIDNKLKKITSAQWSSMTANVPSADDLIPFLRTGMRIKSQENKNSRKKMTSAELKSVKASLKKQSTHVIDKKSKLSKKAKISMRAVKSKKNRFNR